MFRVSQFMHEIISPTPVKPRRDLPGPVVIWNLIRRCNLMCKHCYSISGDVDFPGELSTAQVFGVMDDLKRFKVPVLILSGGEPLLRRDIFEISHRAKSMGFYVGLSSNGTLITEHNIDAIAAVDYNYVGISLDGIGATHDAFRRRAVLTRTLSCRRPLLGRFSSMAGMAAAPPRARAPGIVLAHQLDQQPFAQAAVGNAQPVDRPATAESL